jgi:site-specific DNA-methyltransferase (cytosine-N4-specific)
VSVIYTRDPDFTLLNCDVLLALRALPDELVHCVVTSPPYWGLRDYGTGLWEGGDPDCDHLESRPSRTAASVASSGLEGGKTMIHGSHVYGQECGHCGARRQDRQLGLEATPDEYVARMVEVFREVRRVLRSDGTVWCNLGDSYAAQGGGKAEGQYEEKRVDGATYQFPRTPPTGLKPKDLVGIPWRLAFALQADGWYLRSDIIWSKSNPMPESVTDRPTKSHEYVFLLTKSPRYFFDQEAVREPYQPDSLRPTKESYGAHRPLETVPPGHPTEAYPEYHHSGLGRGPDGRRKTNVQGADGSLQHRDGERWPNSGRNVRSVWEIATQPYPLAHFATYPEELVRRCILAGTSERGCCPECGKPWEREIERGPSHYEQIRGERSWREMDEESLRRGTTIARGAGGHTRTEHGTVPSLRPSRRTDLGFAPTCGCNLLANNAAGAARFAGASATMATRESEQGGLVQVLHPIPCTVLDPFLGSGTTAYVARKHGRRTIGIELNPDYCALAARRMQQLSLLADTHTSETHTRA